MVSMALHIDDEPIIYYHMDETWLVGLVQIYFSHPTLWLSIVGSAVAEVITVTPEYVCPGVCLFCLFLLVLATNLLDNNITQLH